MTADVYPVNLRITYGKNKDRIYLQRLWIPGAAMGRALRRMWWLEYPV